MCAVLVSATAVVDGAQLDFIVQLMTLVSTDGCMRSNIVVVMNVRDFVVALRMGIFLPFEPRPTPNDHDHRLHHLLALQDQA
jgi:hypothetical protein